MTAISAANRLNHILSIRISADGCGDAEVNFARIDSRARGNVDTDPCEGITVTRELR